MKYLGQTCLYSTHGGLGGRGRRIEREAQSQHTTLFFCSQWIRKLKVDSKMKLLLETESHFAVRFSYTKRS